MYIIPFAVHRVYERWDDADPKPGFFRISHIETGCIAATGSTIPNAIEAATHTAKDADHLNTKLDEMRAKLATMTKRA